MTLPAGVTPEDVERAARALAEDASGWSTDWPGFVPTAVAAITAALAGRVVVPREPTEAMSDAGNKWCAMEGECYAAMIAAAVDGGA